MLLRHWLCTALPCTCPPAQTRQLYWRGAGKGGGWGVEVTRADTMCLSDPVRGGGRLLPAAALLATPAPTLAATRAPAPAPVVARTPWSCETGPAPAVTRQQQPSKCGVETRGPEPHCYCLSGGKVHVSIRLDNLPLVVFSPLPSVCLHRRLTAVQVARVGRWDQASSSAAIVVTRKRPVASLQPGPGLDWGPDSRKIGAAALCSEPRPPDFPPRYTTITWAGTSRHSEPDRGQTRSPTPGLPSCARPRLPVLNHSKTFERGWRIDIVVAYNRPLTSSASDSDTGGGKWTTLRKSTFEKLLYINYQTR